MSCNYCWNQPKKYERYDLYLDGKIKADDFVYRTKDESGEIIPIKISEKFEELENRLETHFTFDNSYKTYDELEVAFANRMLKESVIYIVRNEDTSDDPDRRDVYNEYMIMGGKLELIGSGSYAKQQADLDKEIADRIADVNAEEKRAKDEEKRIEEKFDQEIDQEIEDRIADVNAEEERATKAESELKNDIDKEVELRTSQINGLNQEAKQNRNRIEQLESTVSSEITRATKAENELSVRIKTIEDYDIDNRVKQLEIDLPAETSRAQEEENNLLKKFADYTTTVDLEENYATKSSLNDYTKTNDLNDVVNVLSCIQAMQAKIEELEGTIEQLKSYHFVEEPTEPEQGEGGNEPETPTE